MINNKLAAPLDLPPRKIQFSKDIPNLKCTVYYDFNGILIYWHLHNSIKMNFGIWSILEQRVKKNEGTGQTGLDSNVGRSIW